MTIDDIATEDPDWEVVSVYHDYLIDHDEPRKAEALMWLNKNQRWMNRKKKPESGFWFYVQSGHSRYYKIDERHWIPNPFRVFHSYEIGGGTQQETLTNYFKAYEMCTEELSNYYILKSMKAAGWLPAYEELLK